MPKVSVDIPEELLDDLDRHVGDDGKFVNRSDAIRASIRKTLDLLDEIDDRHGRLDENGPSSEEEAEGNPKDGSEDA
ncbi:ribbon-helix-helix domain-containing protein [Halopenitus sp. H-Gu1]|uniref:ribbon-helix-helix domain-containing protein n=1 Tax=Halopenitus sp. H-Gu1 TaxID=3242697 RepID=UPI00359EA884